MSTGQCPSPFHVTNTIVHSTVHLLICPAVLLQKPHPTTGVHYISMNIHLIVFNCIQL